MKIFKSTINNVRGVRREFQATYKSGESSTTSPPITGQSGILRLVIYVLFQELSDSRTGFQFLSDNLRFFVIYFIQQL